MALCALFAGCGGGCGGAPEAGEDDPAVAETGGGDGESSETPEPAPEPVVDPGPPPVLRVLGQPDEHEARVAIRVENRGAEVAELGNRVDLQRRAGDAWEDVSAVIHLRYSCDDPVPDCVTLAPGGTYLPPAWTGDIGDAQCACEECGPAEAGEYRFVVHSCNGAHAIESAAFTFTRD